MLNLLFGNQTTEYILFYLLRNDHAYARQLATRFSLAINSIQNTLLKLEKANILISYTQGRTRIYTFNPQWPFLSEFKTFLEKAYKYLPKEIQEKQYDPPKRKRPRRTGKPL